MSSETLPIGLYVPIFNVSLAYVKIHAFAMLRETWFMYTRCMNLLKQCTENTVP